MNDSNFIEDHLKDEGISFEDLKNTILKYIENKKALAKKLSDMIKLNDPDSERLKSLQIISSEAP